MSDGLECRTCLQNVTDDNALTLETKIYEEKNVLQAIEELASIQIYEPDLLPKRICESCFQCLQSSINFRISVIASDEELKRRYCPTLSDPLFINCDRNNTISYRSSSELSPYLITLKKDNDENTVDDLINKQEEYNENRNNGKIQYSFKIENQCMKPSERRTKLKLKKSNKFRRKRPVSDSDSDIPLDKLKDDLLNIDNHKTYKKPTKEEKGTECLCPICGKLFKAKQNYNSHMTTVHRKRQFRSDKINCLCPDCGKVISGTRQNFVAHRRYHHSDKAQVKRKYSCDICPKKFYREKNLLIHLRIHKGEKGYVCELCPDKSYTQIGGLILHTRKVHLKKPTCTCNYCGKQFYEKHYLETHIRQWHTGERPFSCEICGKSFSCNGTLLRHRKDSHGEKKPCPKCGKMYTEGELRKHLKRHKIREEGIKRKKYTCEYCGTEMNFTSRKRHLLKQHSIMLRGRGETAEKIPVDSVDLM